MMMVSWYNIHAQIANPKIILQGVLKDSDTGGPIEDGNYDLVFNIYDAEEDGTPLLTESHPMVDLQGGLYTIYLGEYEDLSTLAFDKNYYVGVSIGAEELLPRTELTHAPYTMHAYSVTCSGAVGDVKYSILGWEDFQNENGDCWVPMDGREIEGTALEQTFKWSKIPDASGVFFRAQEWEGGADNDPDRTRFATIATIQESGNKEHTHTMASGGAHSHGMSPEGEHFHDMGSGTTCSGTDSSDNHEIIHGLGFSNSAGVTSTTAGSHIHDIDEAGEHTHEILEDGADEFRPKNMNFYVYVRVN